MENKKKLAIIGAGPRGCYALEEFILQLSHKIPLSQLEIFVFEETGEFGSGQVYIENQIESNWINISERLLALPERQEIKNEDVIIPRFPSYFEWIEQSQSTLNNQAVDTFPPRSKLGKYLNERFHSFATPLQQANILTLKTESVQKVNIANDNLIQLITAEQQYDNIDEVLLTIGHQPTDRDEQIKKWKSIADTASTLSLIENPYPVKDYLTKKQLTNETNIAIRGFGLAMIDVTRAIANYFGEFTKQDVLKNSYEYISDSPLKKRIIPFSLDGLPPAPKPVNLSVDKQFQPDEDELLTFAKTIGDKTVQASANSIDFLLHAFAPIAANRFIQILDKNNQPTIQKRELEQIIKQWLKDQKTKHELIISTEQPVETTLRTFIDIALGNAITSLDYCIGQVWRHCQPTLYDAFAYNTCTEEVIHKIVQLDESTKRYSYGPPVESIQQLVTLIDAGELTLDFVNDPSIELDKNGWTLNNGKQTITTTMMIDSVLDGPKINAVTSPLVKNLLQNESIAIVHSDLGVDTDDNSYLISKNEQNKLPIALLGRLAKGTVIGVDAILECFGNQPTNWAKKAAKQFSKT